MKYEYKSKPEVKSRRVKDQQEKIREGMEKQRIDKAKGATYGSGIGVSSPHPPEVLRLENEFKKKNNIECSMLGCHEAGHKRSTSKKCTYHGLKKADLIEAAMDSRLQELYPSQYGKDICLQ